MVNYYMINNLHMDDQVIKNLEVFIFLKCICSSKCNLHAAALLVTVQLAINSMSVPPLRPLV